MKKLNREAFAKYASRFFLVLMSFLLILSLCSATAPSVSVPLLIQNPDNIPQDYSFLTFDDGQTPLEFGTNYVDAFYVGVVNGLIDDVAVDIPDGDYLGFGIRITQSYGYSNSLSFSGELFEFEGIPVYLSDSPSVTVIDGNPVDVPAIVMFFVPVNITHTITSVWTSITNWVISSLNTVQGLFYGAGEEVITPDTTSTDTLVYNGVTYYPIDYARAEASDNGLMYFYGSPVNINLTTQEVVNVDGIEYHVVGYLGNAILIYNPVSFDTYSPVGVQLVLPSEGSLTLLGTLTVIGLSMSLAFLVIGVIFRFLKLRG